MTTTPFRAAFWAMGLAFAMTALLVVPNPNKIRLALRAQRHQPLLPYERSLLAHVNQAPASMADEVTPSAAPVKMEATVALAPPPKLPPSVEREREIAKPVQVAASNNLTAPLGIPSPEPRVEEVLLTPAPTKIAVAVAAPVPDFSAMTPAKSGPETALDIPVPDPIQRTSQLTSSPSQLAAVTTSPQSPVVPNIPNPSTNDLAEFGVTVIAGATPGKWSFHFEDTPLPIVLRVIGQQCGLSMMVDPSIGGSYSGEFPESDPVQALGMIVKFHRYTVSRRGSYMLIGIREEELAPRTSATR